MAEFIDPLEEAKRLKHEQVTALWIEKRNGGIDYAAMETVFSSKDHSANAIISYQIAGTVPIGFTIEDINGNFVVVTLAQLLALNTGNVDLHYLCQLRANIHNEFIETLTTVEEVENYDITTGWPTVPWVI